MTLKNILLGIFVLFVIAPIAGGAFIAGLGALVQWGWVMGIAVCLWVLVSLARMVREEAHAPGKWGSQPPQSLRSLWDDYRAR